MVTDREKLRQRLNALRAKTVERGCTEAEALAAAEKMAQIMRDHGLSEADLVMEEKLSRRAGKGRGMRAKLWPIIAVCTNTASIILRRGDASGVSFIGRAPGPDIAVYLRDVCDRAIDRAIRDFKDGFYYRKRRGLRSKRAAVADFTDGLVHRLGIRLLELFRDTFDEGAFSTAIATRDERYTGASTLPEVAAPLKHVGARVAGWRAGNDVHLAHGVGAAKAPALIGGAS